MTQILFAKVELPGGEATVDAQSAGVEIDGALEQVRIQWSRESVGRFGLPRVYVLAVHAGRMRLLMEEGASFDAADFATIPLRLPVRGGDRLLVRLRSSEPCKVRAIFVVNGGVSA